MLGQVLISALGTVNFSWESSPSLTELEVLVVNWMAHALGLPRKFRFDLEDAQASRGGGCIHNGASDAIFVAVLTARRLAISRALRKRFGPSVGRVDREKRTQASYEILSRLVAYYSDQSHSAIEKACILAAVQHRAVKSDRITFTMRAEELEAAIQEDLAQGLIPFHLHTTVGTTNLGEWAQNVHECM